MWNVRSPPSLYTTLWCFLFKTTFVYNFEQPCLKVCLRTCQTTALRCRLECNHSSRYRLSSMDSHQRQQLQCRHSASSHDAGGNIQGTTWPKFNDNRHLREANRLAIRNFNLLMKTNIFLYIYVGSYKGSLTPTSLVSAINITVFVQLTTQTHTLAPLICVWGKVMLAAYFLGASHLTYFWKGRETVSF